MKNYFLLAILVLAVYAEAIGSISGNDPTSFYLSVLARSVFIPSAYLYFRHRIEKANWAATDLIHFLPCSLVLVTGIVTYAGGQEINTAGEGGYFIPGSFVYKSLLLLINITAAFYFLLLLQLFKSKARTWFEQESFRQPVFKVDEPQRDVNTSTPAGPIALTEQQISRMDKLVKDYLETNQPFLQHRYSLKDLAEGTNIPLHHLSAFINKHYGINFNDFINGFRVQYCKQKILNRECEQKKLEAIAQESGFSNRNTFTSAFKKVTGVNPSEFLKSSHLEVEKKMDKSQELVEEPASVPIRYNLAVDQYS